MKYVNYRTEIILNFFFQKLLLQKHLYLLFTYSQITLRKKYTNICYPQVYTSLDALFSSKFPYSS